MDGSQDKKSHPIGFLVWTLLWEQFGSGKLAAAFATVTMSFRAHR